jgi:hypothetical protein
VASVSVGAVLGVAGLTMYKRAHTTGAGGGGASAPSGPGALPPKPTAVKQSELAGLRARSRTGTNTTQQAVCSICFSCYWCYS